MISAASRGQVRPVWDLLYYHYGRRLSLDVPYIKAIAESVRPEGGGDYGSTSGGFDQTGFGTCCMPDSHPRRAPDRPPSWPVRVTSWLP